MEKILWLKVRKGILKKGKVDILVIDKYIRILNEKEYFDGRALIFHEKHSASIKANGNEIVLYISQSVLKM